MQEEHEKAIRSIVKRQMEEMSAQDSWSAEFDESEESPEQQTALPVMEQPRRRRVQSYSGLYVKKSERYAEMKSSASAFLVIGCATLAAAILCFAGIIPIAASAKMTFAGVLGAIGVLCLLIFLKTKKAAAAMKEEVELENQKTEKLISSFLASHTARSLDKELSRYLARYGKITPEELSLKRYELIQDYLITENDLSDQSYVDSLSEEIYNKLYSETTS
ncbi:MAG: hypothetical protein Q4F29_00105 [Lachnospiraceae bacterium]|nr:hypothetical protein [Lachnospiraceae bacterium]